MGLFRRRPSAPPVPPDGQQAALDLGSALEIVLVRAVESQANMAVKYGEVIASQLETMAGAFQRKFASKGGKARAAKAARNANGTFKTGRKCRLCNDATIADPSAAEIRAHADHSNPYAVQETEIIQTPEGHDVVECPECSKGLPHEHGRN